MATISRYDNVKITKDTATGKPRLGLFPKINGFDLFDQTDIVITVQEGMTLDYLAQQHLGNGRYWWIIALMNNLSMPVGDFMKGGIKLVIPTNISKITNMIANRQGDK